eukprot:766554-Hanusia_phi.AAC.2
MFSPLLPLPPGLSLALCIMLQSMSPFTIHFPLSPQVLFLLSHNASQRIFDLQRKELKEEEQEGRRKHANAIVSSLISPSYFSPMPRLFPYARLPALIPLQFSYNSSSYFLQFC